LAVALQYIHAIGAGILALGAVAAMTSVLLVFQLGQARIFMSMARDGLLPPPGRRACIRSTRRRTSPHHHRSVRRTFRRVRSDRLGAGAHQHRTLFAFVLVALGIIVLRRREPDRPAVPDAVVPVLRSCPRRSASTSWSTCLCSRGCVGL